MPTKIDVLDHGYVRLVSYMQPAEITSYPTDTVNEVWTGDLEIVRNARVSYDADWRSGEDEGKDEKLIGYMYNNRHTSPFEAMVFTFEIKCPMFIARQWHRHRTWSYNEVSARYTELPDDYYVPDPEHIGTQSATNKQARDVGSVSKAEGWALTIRNASVHAHTAYRMLLDDGVPRELARSVLPVNTYTRYFGTVDLHNLMHFLRLRADSHAQWEIQQYAHAIIDLIKPICPVAVGLLIDELAQDANG